VINVFSWRGGVKNPVYTSGAVVEVVHVHYLESTPFGVGVEVGFGWELLFPALMAEEDSVFGESGKLFMLRLAFHLLWCCGLPR
jgi:hypothetical protein